MRFRSLVEYDGTAFYGYQRQRDGVRTVQEQLEGALATFLKPQADEGEVDSRPIIVTAAGRTDRGVHATGQVISFDLAWSHGCEKLQRALNANLPEDVVVREVAIAADDFHPRFDARTRAYEYLVYNRPVPSPIRRLHSWHVRQPLDVEKMNAAAQLLIGTHDFATFGQPPQGNNSVRTVFKAEWYTEQTYLRFEIEANAFLFRMVRSIVGSLRAVGDGSWTVEQFCTAFEAANRAQAGQTAPPEGLTLVNVTY